VPHNFTLISILISCEIDSSNLRHTELNC
jgi:hypothetical protein